MPLSEARRKAAEDHEQLLPEALRLVTISFSLAKQGKIKSLRESGDSDVPCATERLCAGFRWPSGRSVRKTAIGPLWEHVVRPQTLRGGLSCLRLSESASVRPIVSQA